MDAVLLTPGCSDPFVPPCGQSQHGNGISGSLDEILMRKKSHGQKEEWNFLKELGFKTAAMALKQDSIFLDDPSLRAEEKLAVILGTEGDGLASDTIADCDYTVMIPHESMGWIR